MPALPELEILRRDLEREVVTRRIKDADVRPGQNAMKVIARHGRRKDFQDLVVQAKVDKVDRVGAQLLLHLDNGNIIVITLSEGATLRKTSASEPLQPNTHIVLSFTIGGQLRLVDPSKSSEVYAAPKDEVEGALERAAIDPLEYQMTWHQFSGLLAEADAPMKDLLLDGRFVAALGDVYSDEILFAAGLRYDRPSTALSSQDVRRLYRALMEVLQESVKARGATTEERPWVDLQGDPGGYGPELKVFGREGEFCRRCRNDIVKERYGDRVTYLCPQCQT